MILTKAVDTGLEEAALAVAVVAKVSLTIVIIQASLLISQMDLRKIWWWRLWMWANFKLNQPHFARSFSQCLSQTERRTRDPRDLKANVCLSYFSPFFISISSMLNVSLRQNTRPGISRSTDRMYVYLHFHPSFSADGGFMSKAKGCWLERRLGATIENPVMGILNLAMKEIIRF